MGKKNFKMVKIQLLDEIYQPAPYGPGHAAPRRFKKNQSDILLVDLNKVIYARTFTGLLEEDGTEDAIETTFIEMRLSDEIMIATLFNDDLLGCLV